MVIQLESTQKGVRLTPAGDGLEITLTIDRPQLSSQDIEKLETAQRNNRVSE